MNEVYWLEQSESQVPDDDHWLGPAEAAHLGGLHIPKRRADWRLGRWTAKHALAACLKLPAGPDALRCLEIIAAPSGAPAAFHAGKPLDVRISLTHRGGIAVCAVALTSEALGCDLEVIEPRSYAFTTDYFTAEEQMLVSRSPVTDRVRLITLLWSAKESTLKALETGLRLDTRSVTVSPIDAARCWGRNGVEAWLPIQVRCAAVCTFHGWWRQTRDSLLTIVAAPPADPPVLLRRA